MGINEMSQLNKMLSDLKFQFAPLKTPDVLQLHVMSDLLVTLLPTRLCPNPIFEWCLQKQKALEMNSIPFSCIDIRRKKKGIGRKLKCSKT